jgi:chemotaxis protein methyltransferase CheR
MSVLMPAASDHAPDAVIGDLAVVRAAIAALTGIQLDGGKDYFVAARLEGLRQQEGDTTIADLCERARRASHGPLARRLIDAITVKETLFFRDGAPFELLRRHLLPALIARRGGQAAGRPAPVRIWSAACSTGQEVYSLAILLRELLGPHAGERVQLLGTDISGEAVARAREGVYSRFEIERGLGADQLARYFEPAGRRWRVREDLRALARFETRNLLAPLTLGPFDLVLCRNVAIYFDLAVRKDLFARLARTLDPGGFLLVGATESLVGVDDRFTPRRQCGAVYYQIHGGGVS